MDQFDVCYEVNSLYRNGREDKAREKLFYLLEYLRKEKSNLNPVTNHLVRILGLQHYIQYETARWDDRYAKDAFTVDVKGEEITLHQSQSNLLSELLEGNNIAVSAPTSFGKSLLIDAFIAIKKPKIVVVIVPTLALMDECRRRVLRRFGDEYSVITTPDEVLEERTILIFPQERALKYYRQLSLIDLLVVDEFYKAKNVSESCRDERILCLQEVIVKLKSISRQCFFLAPNISSLSQSSITEGLKFIRIHLTTVALEVHEVYRRLESVEESKKEVIKKELLLEIVAKGSKNLIFAGTYSKTDELLRIFSEPIMDSKNSLCLEFSEWITENYGADWMVAKAVKAGVGVHNASLHRSLSQLMIEAFGEAEGLHSLVSTSSIIEGVNTAAKNVIVWHNRNGSPMIKPFDYKNLIGRAGRMFRYFVGNVFLMVEPPREEDENLSTDFPDEVIPFIEDVVNHQELTDEQLRRLAVYREEVRHAFGDRFELLLKGGEIQSSNAIWLKKLAFEIYRNPSSFQVLKLLNGSSENWDNALYRMQEFEGVRWEAKKSHVVHFIKIISQSWENTLPAMIAQAETKGISIDRFFTLERNLPFKIGSVLGDFNLINLSLFDATFDISPFIARVSRGFLPPLVFFLEEYGLPRMIARAMHDAKLFDFEADMNVVEALQIIKDVGEKAVIEVIGNELPFNTFVVRNFFAGIKS